VGRRILQGLCIALLLIAASVFATAAPSFSKINLTVQTPWEKQAWDYNPLVKPFVVARIYLPPLYYSPYMLGLDGMEFSAALVDQRTCKPEPYGDETAGAEGKIALNAYVESCKRWNSAKEKFKAFNPKASAILYIRGLDPSKADSLIEGIGQGGAAISAIFSDISNDWDAVMGESAESLRQAVESSDYAIELLNGDVDRLEETGIADTGYGGKAREDARAVMSEVADSTVAEKTGNAPAGDFSKIKFKAAKKLAELNALLDSNLPLLPKSKFKEAIVFVNENKTQADANQRLGLAIVTWPLLATYPMIFQLVSMTVAADTIISYFQQLYIRYLEPVGEGLAENDATYHGTMNLLVGDEGVVEGALGLHALARGALETAKEECRGESKLEPRLALEIESGAVALERDLPEKFDFAFDRGSGEIVPVYVGGTFSYRSAYLKRQAGMLKGNSEETAGLCASEKYGDAYQLHRQFMKTYSVANQTLADVTGEMEIRLAEADSGARLKTEELGKKLGGAESVAAGNFALANEKYETAGSLIEKSKGAAARGERYEALLNAYYAAKEGVDLLKPQGIYLQILKDKFAVKANELKETIETGESIGVDVSPERKELEGAYILMDRMNLETDGTFIALQEKYLQEAINSVKHRAEITYSHLDGDREYILRFGNYTALPLEFYSYEQFAKNGSVGFIAAFEQLKEMDSAYKNIIFSLQHGSAGKSAVAAAVQENARYLIVWDGERVLDKPVGLGLWVESYNPLPVGADEVVLEVPGEFGLLKGDVAMGEVDKVVSFEGKTKIYARAKPESKIEIAFEKKIIPAETIADGETVSADKYSARIERELAVESRVGSYWVYLPIDGGSIDVSLECNNKNVPYAIAANSGGTFTVANITSALGGRDKLLLGYALPEPYAFARYNYSVNSSNYYTTVNYDFSLVFKRQLGGRIVITEYEPIGAAKLETFAFEMDGKPGIVAKASVQGSRLVFTFEVGNPGENLTGKVSYSVSDPRAQAEYLQLLYGNAESRTLIDSGDYAGAVSLLMNLRKERIAEGNYHGQYETGRARLANDTEALAGLLALQSAVGDSDKLERYEALAESGAARGDYKSALSDVRKAQGVLYDLKAQESKVLREEYKTLFRGYNVFKGTLPARYSNETAGIDGMFGRLQAGIGGADVNGSLGMMGEIRTAIDALNQTYIEDGGRIGIEAEAIRKEVGEGLANLSATLEAYNREYNKKAYPFVLTPTEIRKRIGEITEALKTGERGAPAIDKLDGAREEYFGLVAGLGDDLDGLKNLTSRTIGKAESILPSADKAKQEKLSSALEAAKRLYSDGYYSDALAKAQGVYSEAAVGYRSNLKESDLMLLGGLTAALGVVLAYYYWKERKKSAKPGARELRKEG